jgi:peptide/nickel transport system permease protein
MRRLVIRRLWLAGLTLLGVSFVVFLLVHLTPGDPARAIAGPYASETVVESFRSQYHLDDPMPLQYGRWLWDALRGDFGRSAHFEQSVNSLVFFRLTNTFVLVGAALLVAVSGGILLGLLAGRRETSRTARLLMAANLVTANVPPYLSGLILILVFSLTLELFPSGGMYDFRQPGGLPDLLAHLVLPTIAVAAQPMMVIARMTRASILEVSRQDYVLVAQSVGITPRRIATQYILWNALPPVISVIGLQVGSLLSGALFAEVVFSWPGLGELLFQALSATDVLTIQAVTLLIALTFILVNLLADLLISFINPRSRGAA